MRVRVKVCGITRAQDARAAAAAGADAIGLVFYPQSPRFVSTAQARTVIAALPPFVTVTGLFLDPEPAFVQEVLDELPLDVLQFHGSESPEFCRAFGLRYIKAVPMGDGVDIGEYARRYADAAALLLDSHGAGQRGGTGVTFAWSLAPKIAAPPLILAGGLTPGNVAAAIAIVRPHGVDVSSGVESAPGIKDTVKLAAFIREVNRAAEL